MIVDEVLLQFAFEILGLEGLQDQVEYNTVIVIQQRLPEISFLCFAFLWSIVKEVLGCSQARLITRT